MATKTDKPVSPEGEQQENKNPTVSAKQTQSNPTVSTADRLPTYVYLGPTLKTYALRQNATYVNGIPEQFKQLVEADTDVAFLFVPLSLTVEYRRELKDPSSEHSYVFKQIQKSGV